MKQGKHMKNNTEGIRKLLHNILKTLKIVFDAIAVLKTIIEFFQ